MVFDEDLYNICIYKGIQINDKNKKTFYDIAIFLDKCFEEKKKSKYFKYRDTYLIYRIIIKYIPKKNNKEYQTRLYNLFKIFDKEIGPPIEIESIDLLYSDVNKGIIEYINESISRLGNITEASKIIDNIFNLINENNDILDPENYPIIPNQLGEFKKLNELKKGNELIQELLDIVSKYTNIKSVLIDNKIESFNPSEIISNDFLKRK